MKGTLYTITTTRIEATPIDGPPDLATLKAAIGGGYLEPVPGFDAIVVGDVEHECVAFCDEDGKRKQLPVNAPATGLWHHCLMRRGHPGLLTPAGTLTDYLVGPIAVVTGDVEFMAAL